MSSLKEKIVLVNSLSPGDVLIMTAAIRSLMKAHPGRYELDVRSPCNEIFMNSPYITPIRSSNPAKELQIIEELKKDLDHEPIEFEGIKFLISHYPEIHRSGMSGAHFSDGHRLFLAQQLKIDIPASGLQPDIFFSPSELASVNPIVKFYPSFKERYWVINAGIKNDYTLKWYNHYQEVVDLLKERGIQCVQIGHLSHDHKPLENVIDMRGKTNLRELFRICNDADGVISCVSMPMVVAAALRKPCVVVAGAREGVRWQLNPDHQFLYRNGVMSCATYDGCWKSRTGDCINKHENGQPMCMELISPEEIVRAVELYYLGGRLSLSQEIKPNMVQKVAQTKISFPKSAIEPFKLFEKSPEKTPFLDQKTIENEEKVITFSDLEQKRMINSSIFNILRILKKYNPDDQYLEAYRWHYEKRGETFMDSYHVMHWIGSHFAPKRILEIGCRTGISICQLLSSYFDYSKIEQIVLCDVFAEQGSPEQVIRNLEHLNIPARHLEIITGSSLDEMPKLIGQQRFFDYILVDGCHDKDYARADLHHSVQLIEKNGFILFDDLTPDGCSLQDVWDEFKDQYKTEFIFLEDHNGKGIGVAKRR